MIFPLPPNNLEKIISEDYKPRRNLTMWFDFIYGLFRRGFTGTITTAKLTGGGANGSMTFENGVLISQVAAT